VTDPDLKNPRGNSLSPPSSLWLSDQASDNPALYSITPGSSTAAKSTAVQVTMPDSVAGPGGQVANTGTGFVLGNGTVKAPAAFIFATPDGHIEAWSPKVDPLIGDAEDKVTVPGAGYAGLAIARTGHRDRLFAADFLKGRVEVFDSAFHPVQTAPRQFTGPRLPNGLRPFNVQALNGHIFVTHDSVDPAAGFEGTGPHAGAADEFSTHGHLISRIASGKLNAPWGLATAPSGRGRVAGTLPVGNFGDGRINIIAKHRHHYSPQEDQ
jgi:uncharacterized protein (TIGR03118 family)